MARNDLVFWWRRNQGPIPMTHGTWYLTQDNPLTVIESATSRVFGEDYAVHAVFSMTG